MITLTTTVNGKTTTSPVEDTPIARRRAAQLLMQTAIAGGSGIWQREGSEPIVVGR